MGQGDNRKKVRADFRKNRQVRTRANDLTRRYASDDEGSADDAHGERISGKGELTRKRTILSAADVQPGEGDEATVLNVDLQTCQRGLVLSAHGLSCRVLGDDGALYRCAVRRILKTLSTDERHVVVAGDHVYFRHSPGEDGMIERVEPRSGVIARESRGRRHILVANVDQVLIITSAAEPNLKPNLIDRFLVTAEKYSLKPIVCINKIDLVDPADLQPLAGVYGQLGYQVLFVSATRQVGVDTLRRMVRGRQSVVTGQSGVGKSSLLNAIEPGLELRVKTVSTENEKGRHTTTAAQLIPLTEGGCVVDTPGIRQFQLWDVIPQEVAGYFRDIRPYVSNCRFPDCTHQHEADCAVKNAVADGHIDARRYESFCQIMSGDEF